ncbi:MAG: hypothetical protein AAF226_11690 [Verrucomicrobiota bacterium]
MAIRLAETTGGGTLGSQPDHNVTRSWWVDTEDEIFTVIAQETHYRDLPQASYDFSTVSDKTLCAGYKVDITFQGETVDGNGDDEETAEQDQTLEDAIWSFRPAFEKEPIEKHKDIKEFIETYDGQEDVKTRRVTFPRILSKQPENDRRGLVGEKDKDGNLKNPLFGYSESGYMVMGGVATAVYQTYRTETALLGIGTVFKTLPANAPDFGVGPDRDWIKMPPTITEVEALTQTRTGIFIGPRETERRLYEIEHSFMLSGKGGWEPAVYELSDL